MSTTKQFECEECGAFGKIVIRGDEIRKEDIAFCPCCGRDIYDDEEDFEDDE